MKKLLLLLLLNSSIALSVDKNIIAPTGAINLNPYTTMSVKTYATGWQERLKLLNDGKFGIGKTPTQSLDVSGNINMSTGGSYKINGTDVLSSTTLGSGAGVQIGAYLSSGPGGHSCLGGSGSSSANAAGFAGVANTGSGGSGGGTSSVGGLNFTGTSGGAGGCIDVIISSPGSSYSYAVGAGGTAGANGTSGLNGSAGGSGLIIIEEHYI
jgi:hypothetical protein